MVRNFVAAFFALLAFIPLAAEAVQFDGVKNLTTSARTYNLTNPTQNITVQPGQTVVIQDSQFTSNTSLVNDVQSGYMGEYAIGTPNATVTVYAQPITVTSNSNASAGITINSQSGQQPAIQLNQVNAGDLLDAYQSNSPELLFGNTLFHLYTPATFEHNLIIDNSSPAAGIIQFGSDGSVLEQFTTSATGAGLAGLPSSAFGFTNAISTNDTRGYYIGASQVLSAAYGFQNLIIGTPGNSGFVGFINQGSTSNFAQLSSSGLALSDGSNMGHNTLIQGNLQVLGTTSFNFLTANQLTVGTIVSPNNANLFVRPGVANGQIVFQNAGGSSTTQTFNNDGSLALANNNVQITPTGQINATSVYAPLWAVSGAGYFSNDNGFTQYLDYGGKGFQISNSIGTVLDQFNADGSGTLGQGSISYTTSGVLNLASISTSGNISTQELFAVGISAGDIYASRAANSGVLFLGTNGQHYVQWNGATYYLSPGPIALNGNTTVNGDIFAQRNGPSGAVYLGNTGTRYLFYDGTNYNLNGADLIVPNVHAGTYYGSGAGLLTDTVPVSAIAGNVITGLLAGTGVTITNPNSANPTIAFTGTGIPGPKGDTGATGATGPAGPAGQAGGIGTTYMARVKINNNTDTLTATCPIVLGTGTYSIWVYADSDLGSGQMTLSGNGGANWDDPNTVGDQVGIEHVTLGATASGGQRPSVHLSFGGANNSGAYRGYLEMLISRQS